MKNAFRLLVLIIAIVTAYLRAPQSPAQEAPAPRPAAAVSSAPGMFTDVKNGYQIKPPDGWKVAHRPKSRDLVKLDINLESERSGLQVRVYPRRHATLDAFADWYAKDFAAQMTGSRLIDRRSRTLGANAVIMLRFDGSARNGYFLKTYLIEGKNCFYVMQSGCPFAARATIEPLLDALAATFVVL